MIFYDFKEFFVKNLACRQSNVRWKFPPCDSQAILLKCKYIFTVKGYVTLTNAELKQYNRNQVYRIIYGHRTIAKSDIASQLHLSLPTISQFITELEETGLVAKNGFFKSTGGRKPSIFSCIGDARIAIGIELIKEHFQVVAADLYGNVLFQETYHIPFANEASFFRQFGDSVQAFILQNKISPEKILGIGIALQGLVSYDGTAMTYGEILTNNGLTVDCFNRYLDYPLLLIHDAEAAATDALWNSADIKDAIFLSLSRNLGGAIIINHQIHWGAVYPSGLFEHMTIVPNGVKCYCGKKGCLESYCSAKNLLAGLDSTPDSFFESLRKGHQLRLMRWNQFLSHLAIAIDNLQMTLNCDVILGGHLAPYLNQSDLDTLTFMVTKDSAFNQGRPAILLEQNSCIARGAALYFVRQFIDSI